MTGQGTGAARGSTGRSMWLAALLATASASAMVIAVPAVAQTAARQTNFNIPATSLTSALAAFGRQAGLQVTYLPQLAAGKHSPGVSGTMPADAALTRLLQGSGLNFSFSNARTVAISAAGAAGGGAVAVDGAIQLDTIDVSGNRVSAADTPYQTPGSVSYISSQQMERFPGSTAGDMFAGTPGVISGSNSNGASIDPNIRGMQGMNRVATTIDGSEQSTSSYRGYSGTDSRTYVDPDLIGGATITKGPGEGASGAIGGTIALETLNAEDILKPGNTYGTRVKVTSSPSGVAPDIWATVPRTDDRFNPGNGSISVAVAATQENVDFVSAFVRRKTGNYFAGRNGTLYANGYGGVPKLMSSYGHGDEVFNTSENVTSGLMKLTLRPADGHELKLTYMHYDNNFGEITSSNANAGSVQYQIPLAMVAVDQLSARYHWKPVDNDYIDLRTTAYMSNINEDVNYSLWDTAHYNKTRTRNYGGDIANTSRLDLIGTPASLTYGGSFKLEDASPRRSAWQTTDDIGAFPVHGTRQIETIYAKGTWEPLSWLKFNSGIEFLDYRTEYLGTPAYTYSGAPYAPYKGDGFSPSGGVTITPVEGWQLFVQYASGIRPPSLRESSWVRSDWIFNPDLVAERAQNLEFGTNLLRNDVWVSGDKARLKLAYFDNVTKDYIGRRYDLGRLQMFNYDYVQFKGIELSGGYDNKYGFIDYAFNYYTDFKGCLVGGTCISYTVMSDYLSNQMPPRFTTAISGGLRFFDGKATIGGRYRYTGDRLVPLVNDGSYGAVAKEWAAYSLVDLFAQWKVSDDVTVDLTAANLLDRYYVDALNNGDIPAPGRTIRLALTGKLGGNEPWSLPSFGFAPAATRSSDWSGVYAGVHAGHGFAAVTGTTTAANGSSSGVSSSEAADQRLKNILGGFQIGFNYELPSRIVLGAEADFSWAQMADYREVAATETATLIERKRLEARTDYEMNWLSTVRGKLGYAFDRWFVYGTAGAAFMKETEERTQYRATSASTTYPAGHTTDYFFSETDDHIRIGWTVGAGAEYKLDSHWSLKGEYLYAGFGAQDFEFDNARAGVAQTFSTSVRCTPFPACYRETGSLYVTTVYPGSSDHVNGRKASNSADVHALKVGLNYRF